MRKLHIFTRIRRQCSAYISTQTHVLNMMTMILKINRYLIFSSGIQIRLLYVKRFSLNVLEPARVRKEPPLMNRRQSLQVCETWLGYRHIHEENQGGIMRVFTTWMHLQVAAVVSYVLLNAYVQLQWFFVSGSQSSNRTCSWVFSFYASYIYQCSLSVDSYDVIMNLAVQKWNEQK